MNPGAIVEGSHGRYAVLSKAGEGGVGTVYKAKNVATSEIVAVKVLHPKRFELTDVQKERFTNEIRESLGIESDYIVKGIDTGTYNDEPFLVLEWLSGGTLQDLIETTDYTEEDVFSLTSQLLKAFQELSRLGLVHRDLKPNNVLLTADKRLKLSDLGLVKKVSAQAFLTASGAHIGSLLYISERQRNEPESVTRRDDFYAVCLILYELVSGRRIHNRNRPLLYLRPELAPMALCRLIDAGMQDDEDWEDTFEELCRYIDLENECLSAGYTGTSTVPERTVQAKVDGLLSLLDVETEDDDPDVTATDSSQTLMDEVVEILVASFNGCAEEIKECGILIDINDEMDDDVLHFGVSFSEELEDVIKDSGKEIWIADPMYGWVYITTEDNGGVVLEGIGSKRFDPDFSVMRDDDFDRSIAQIDSETRAYLVRFGRSMALATALGAIERIEDYAKEEDEDVESDEASNG